VSESGAAERVLTALLEESAEDLYEHAPCGYVSTDSAGLILRLNQTLLDWLGYARSDLVGRRRLQDLFTAGGRIFHETHIAPLLRMQGAVRSIALDIARANGSPLPVLLHSDLKRNAAGEPALIRTTLFDARDRKEYERELVRARKKAEAADRAKAEFISTISHEIRTPLNAIMGVAYLLGGTELSTIQQKFVRTLRSSAENLLNLVNEVLDFSKIESGKVTLEERPVDLRKLAGDVVGALQVKADEKGIALDLRVDEGVPREVTGDPVKLAQVLTNLVGNAIKFTSSGGVTLALSDLGGDSDKVDVRFAVTDTGIGIAPDKLSQIFEDFAQASYDISIKYGGTGLGLAISRKLVELHGSRLIVESALGEGSTFYFDLRLKPTRGEAPPPPPPDERDALRGLRALVVDDNEVNIFVLTRFLQAWGMTCDTAKDGESALERVREASYDVVLLDIRMPKLDGVAVAREIRSIPGERFARLPVIAVSASMRMGQQHEIEEAGFSAFIGKPINPDMLYTLVADLISRSTVNPAPSAAPGSPP
jgi:PAS domain S-box-containing protein